MSERFMLIPENGMWSIFDQANPSIIFAPNYFESALKLVASLNATNIDRTALLNGEICDAS